jgi:hypothetical protein
MCEPQNQTKPHRAVVKWKSGSDLSAIKGRELRLTLKDERAKLFSFYFTE